MQTIQVRYQYYPGGISTWTATSNNPPEGKSSSASGDGYTYSDAETRQAAIGNAGYFGYGSEDTIYVNGEVYQAGKQTIPSVQKLCCPSGWTYDGDFCMSQSGEEVDPPHDCSLFGGVYVEDAPAPPIPYVRPPYQPPPIVEPPYQPPGACPKGDIYRSNVEGVCDEGYEAYTLFGLTDCKCVQATPGIPGTPGTPGISGFNLSQLFNYLPQLLIVYIVITLIGAFRK